MRIFALARTVALLFFVVIFSTLGSLVEAADEKIVLVCNNTGIAVSDLHVTFSGSGGNVSVSPASVFAPGCPTPTVPSNGAVTNTVVIDWGVPCVPPYAWVAFVVRTTNGPLTATGGFWTLGGIPVAPIGPGCVKALPPYPTPPPPAKNKWANKWIYKCSGKVLKSKWKGIPGTFCWGRWECFTGGFLEAKLVRCFFTTRNGRLRELRCFDLTPWFVVKKKAPFWKFKRTTIRPPDVNRPGDLPIVGPPKNAVKRGGKWVLPEKKFSMQFSDDSGQNYREAGDLISAVLETSGQMDIVVEPLPDFPDLSTIPELLKALGPGLVNGGQRWNEAVPEIQDVMVNEPSGTVGILMPTWQQFGMGLQSMGNEFNTGAVPTGSYFVPLETQMLQLASVFPNIEPGNQRFLNAQVIGLNMYDGLRAARIAFQNGLGNPQNVDYMLWGIMNRFQADLPALANALGPHIRVQLGLGNRGWDPTDSDGAQVVIQNASTGEILQDDMLIPIADDGSLIIPTWGTEDVPQLRIRVKFDTYLSETFVVANNDGQLVNLPLRNGDVNGDDAVTTQDINQINADQGMGGALAEEVPETDINIDGIVDASDLAGALPNVGQIGNGFFDVFFEIDLEGIPPGLEATRYLDVELRAPGSGLILQKHTAMIQEDGTTSVPCWHSGPIEIWVKGSRWLATKQLVTVGPGLPNMAPLFLKTGDIDGDNVVSVFDYIRLSDAFDSVPGQPMWDEPADLDGDDVVSVFDYILLSDNFDQEGAA